MNLTFWEIIGILGTAIFSGRWIIQIYRSRIAGKSVVTRDFWYMSICGNLLILSYFTFGNRDLIGIISNLFPTAIALYNIRLTFINEKKKQAE